MKARARIPSSRSFTVPDYLTEALKRNKPARENFQRFCPSAQLAYVYWVESARTDKTRQVRIKKTLELLAANKKLGER